MTYFTLVMQINYLWILQLNLDCNLKLLDKLNHMVQISSSKFYTRVIVQAYFYKAWIYAKFVLSLVCGQRRSLGP